MNTLRSTSTSSSERTDLIIVGAGIVGLAHAYEANRKGYTVRIIERDARPNGASIRNFGHCCVTAQDGELLDTAYRSREGWTAAAKDVGFWAPPVGAYVVARSQLEMTVVEELNGKRGNEAVKLLTATELRSVLGGSPDPAIIGGAHLPADLRVDPRTTSSEIAAWLQAQDGVSIQWSTAVKDISDGTVFTGRGDFHASKVLVCVGHDLDYLFPELYDLYQVQRCALQMALATAPATYKTDAAVLTGTSIARYEAFTAMPGAAALKQEISAHSPELFDMVANVMFARRPDGTLLLGDTHVYGQTLAPFQDERWTRRIVDEVSKVLGTEIKITQRWQGMYSTSPLTALVAEDIDAKTRVITDTCGIGMTMSFGIAADTIANL